MRFSHLRICACIFWWWHIPSSDASDSRVRLPRAPAGERGCTAFLLLYSQNNSSSNLVARSQTIQLEKWAKGLTDTSQRKGPHKHIERFSALLVIRKMQIKTMTRCHFTSTRMADVKRYPEWMLVRVWAAGGRVRWATGSLFGS